MLRKLLFTTTLILMTATISVVGQDIQIGYMNPQEVINKLPELTNIQQQLNTYIQQRQSEYQKQGSDYQQALTTYQNNAASMSEEQQQQREQELTSMQQDLQELQQNIQQQIQQRQADLMSPIYDRMDKAIADVAKLHNLDFVLNEATSYGDQIIYYHGNQTLDITDEVLSHMNNDSN